MSEELGKVVIIFIEFSYIFGDSNCFESISQKLFKIYIFSNFVSFILGLKAT